MRAVLAPDSLLQQHIFVHLRHHDGYVRPQRFLARRIGQPWEDVRAAYDAATIGANRANGLSRFVVESAVLIRRGVGWRAHRVGAAGELVARLRRGQLYVAEGVLRRVGAGPRGVGRGGSEAGGRGRRMRSGDSGRWR